MSGGHLREKQIHPAERLRLPGGGEADIDLPMIPVVQALWRAGITTLGSCQNLGESIARNGHGSSVAAKDRQRWADFYKGFAWLKLPGDDANRLIGLLGADPVFGHRTRRWTHPEAWQAVVWLVPCRGGIRPTRDGSADQLPRGSAHGCGEGAEQPPLAERPNPAEQDEALDLR